MGGGGDIAFGGEVCEKLPDLGGIHFFGVTFVVEEDVVFHPFGVGFFGTRGVAFETEGVAVLVEQFFPLRRRCLFWGRCILSGFSLAVHFVASYYERCIISIIKYKLLYGYRLHNTPQGGILRNGAV